MGFGGISITDKRAEENQRRPLGCPLRHQYAHLLSSLWRRAPRACMIKFYKS